MFRATRLSGSVDYGFQYMRTVSSLWFGNFALPGSMYYPAGKHPSRRQIGLSKPNSLVVWRTPPTTTFRPFSGWKSARRPTEIVRARSVTWAPLEFWLNGDRSFSPLAGFAHEQNGNRGRNRVRANAQEVWGLPSRNRHLQSLHETNLRFLRLQSGDPSGVPHCR